MLPVSRSAQIEFLLQRSFPVEFFISRSSNRPNWELDRSFKDYERKLLSMPNAELRALYEKEQEQADCHRETVLWLQERGRFFHQPSAAADFRHWSKATYWTLDEALALSFGKAPEVVSWGSIAPCIKISPFAANYAKIRDLVLRAHAWKQLSDPVLPGAFLAWARRNDISYPPELEEQVSSRGQKIADWKSAYDELRARSEEQLAARKQQIADWRANFDQLKAQCDEKTATAAALMQDQEKAVALLVEERDQLFEKLSILEQTGQPHTTQEKPLLTRERESALKLIVGMAIGRYRYDPKASRNEATRHIAEDLDRLGLSLDADTVRKWLKEGAEMIPAENGWGR